MAIFFSGVQMTAPFRLKAELHTWERRAFRTFDP